MPQKLSQKSSQAKKPKKLESKKQPKPKRADSKPLALKSSLAHITKPNIAQSQAKFAQNAPNQAKKAQKASFWRVIIEDFSVIKQKDPAINSSIELFFNYPGLMALVSYRFASVLHHIGLRVLARIIMGFVGFITNVDIHPAAKIGRRVFIDHATGVVIGETAEVGNDVMLYQGVTLGGTSLSKVKRHPTIEDGVVIGAGAKILGNITIGANAKIGANSVVVKDVPSDCTAVGIPARVIVKGRAKEASAINKLPDIDRALFEYLFKRMQILESMQFEKNQSKAQAHKDTLKELDELYINFLQSLKH